MPPGTGSGSTRRRLPRDVTYMRPRSSWPKTAGPPMSSTRPAAPLSISDTRFDAQLRLVIAQLRLVIGKRDAIDSDDRHMDDVGGLRAACGRDEVGGGDDVLGARALGGAVDGGVDALAAEQIALRPVDAGVADVVSAAQRADFVAGLGGFADHSVPECAGRAGDENFTSHWSTSLRADKAEADGRLRWDSHHKTNPRRRSLRQGP